MRKSTSLKTIKNRIQWDGRSRQVYSGKPYTVKPQSDGSWAEYEECCDCGLVHFVRYRVVKRKLEITVWVDKRHTRQTRRKRGVLDSII